ncbi:MAG: hypothetical protein A2Y54_07100 [Chloroflexi bacterium RBG_16_51_16]|nr:MAG: hypothetical protein A2Y54_07100 [Chloroflexi bacterium RBG_16_51_16]
MSDLTGKVIADRYRVEEFIGRGGMAEVYKVWDTRRSTTLAMKLLHADLALDRAWLRQFNREAETLARLQHPNIVRFYGLGQDGEQIFMLMDFIEGRSLKQLIFNANGPLPLEQVLNIMRPLCQALQYAHYEGYVHADVKPGNVMIDKSGRVMLNDFGIARMTQTGTATLGGVGTPAYMSPEQARSEKPTPQSDIYSLGILLYEMLTGERPFNGEHALTGETADDRVRWEQLHQPPPSLRNLNRNLSLEIEQVLFKTLSKDPGQRYAGALELSQALEQAILKPGEAMSSSAGTRLAGGLKVVPVDKGTMKSGDAFDPRRSSKLRLAFAGLLVVSVVILIILNNPGLMSAFGSVTSTATSLPVATRTVTTPRVIPSQTRTPLASETPLPTITPTPLIPVVMAKDVSIHCRFGPGINWEAVSSLQLGEQAEIVGKNSELNYTWWYVKDLLNPGQFCWVAVEVTNAYGNLTLIPVVSPPEALVADVTVRTIVDFEACGGLNPVKLRGTVKTNGPASADYQWEITGDANLTTEPVTLVFDSAGTKNVADDESIKLDCGEYTLRLHVTEPNDTSSLDRFAIP